MGVAGHECETEAINLPITLQTDGPDDLHDLEEQLQGEFRSLAGSQSKLRGCIQQSELPFSLP